MTREIKFRAWNPKTKRMFPVGQMDFCIGGLAVTDGYTESGKPNDHEVMQSTGLLDKNGKEIYEGDIVKIILENHIHSNVNFYCAEPIKLGELFKVKWFKAGYMLIPVEYDFNDEICNRSRQVDNYAFWNGSNALEIIGNIYENPGLLT